MTARADAANPSPSSDTSLLAEVELPDTRVLADVALTPDEYRLAVARLERAPTHVELGIIGALWSEHCGYKTSKPLLRRLPTTGPRVIQGPGENAGAVDIGEGLAAVFKIESHNHPSAIEPYQGAATGVGGILRDVFTMGARPIALLDSLRFGPLDEPRQRHLFDGVVAGIGGYGNCIGVPTVGGEVYFDASYRHNCLVNAMCVGIIEQSRLTRAKASGAGNTVLLVGADTGRDGIHGATFASVQLDDQSEERRPAVQVGNPFLEKCLMEACLELAGDPRVIAMQDLGAAGLTSSTAELAHRGGCGIDVDVARVSRRERGMTPYEVMLSESQERMLLVVRAGDEQGVIDAFARWDLHTDAIGTITDTGRLVVRDEDEVVCDLPLDMLVDEVPLRHPAVVAPEPRPQFDPLRETPPWPASEALLRLLRSPNIGSRRPVWRRYDHQVGDDTVVRPGGDAAVLRIKGTGLGVAVTTDGNARYGELDPRRGAAIAVAEAARNCVAVGAEPVAVTNCLNFGNPEKSEVFFQLSEAIDGMSEACRALGTPVVSGNVSLYNDTSGVSIAPTPVVGMVGVLDDVSRRLTPAFAHDGDKVFLVGPIGAELGGSEYQRIAHGVNAGDRPALDLALESRVQRAVLDGARAGLLRSAHDVSDGGLAVALAECCIAGRIGASCSLPEDGAATGVESGTAGILFGETQSRFLLSCVAERAAELQDMIKRHNVPFGEIGTVSGDRIMIGGSVDVSVADATAAFEAALLED